jgi:hypothetical protein
MDDFEMIYLQAEADADYAGDGRLWCQDDVWSCEPENQPPTKYIRADIAEARERAAADGARREAGEVLQKVDDLLGACVAEADMAGHKELRDDIGLAQETLWPLLPDTSPQTDPIQVRAPDLEEAQHTIQEQSDQIDALLFRLSAEEGQATRWECKDYADGWIRFDSAREANAYQAETGCLLRVTYMAMPTGFKPLPAPPSPDPVAAAREAETTKSIQLMHAFSAGAKWATDPRNRGKSSIAAGAEFADKLIAEAAELHSAAFPTPPQPDPVSAAREAVVQAVLEIGKPVGGRMSIPVSIHLARENLVAAMIAQETKP